MLAVRAMAGETAWLDGRPRWRDGRVVWELDGRLVAPAPAVLSVAERRLKQVAGLRGPATRTLGDVDAWLERRRERLELAKRLQLVQAPDIPALGRLALGGDRKACEMLRELIVAEALCANGLPSSPTVLLVACGPAAVDLIRQVVEDDALPPGARGLGALALGATQRSDYLAGVDVPLVDAPPGQGWLVRAQRYGLEHGLPAEPALGASLLQCDSGAELIRRLRYVLHGDGPLAPTPQLLRELLEQGEPAPRVVLLAERLVAAGVTLGQSTTDRPAGYAASLRTSIHRLARASGDPAVVDLAAALAVETLALAPTNSAPVSVEPAPGATPVDDRQARLVEAVDRLLGRALDLPRRMQQPWLQLLVSEHARFFDRTTMPEVPDAADLAVWLARQEAAQVRPVLALLQATEDPELAAAAFTANLHERLATHGLFDRELCGWLVGLAPAFDLSGNSSLADGLGSYLATQPAAARAPLRAIVDAIPSESPAVRGHLLESFLDVTRSRPDRWDASLARAAPHAGLIARFGADDPRSDCLCEPLVKTALLLEDTSGDEAGRLMRWLVDHLSTLERTPGLHSGDQGRLGLLGPLAAVVADGSLERFQSLIRMTFERNLAAEREISDDQLAPLGRFPALRLALAADFQHQPDRCLMLLERLGLAARLGPGSLGPVADLDRSLAAEPNPAELPPGWRPVLALAPELNEQACRFVRSVVATGGSGDVPPGVRHAVEQPTTLARELEYLERLCAAQPERMNLRGRLANLRARLSDPEREQAAARAEAAERLELVTAAAQLEAFEQRVRACFRARLESIVGGLPPDLVFDDDLLNATLLLIEIRQNRRLLLRLLRAYLRGDRTWRERHPANAALLRALEARGVEVGAWLRSHPRAYRCPGVPGGRVRLHLEREPIRILQMGNYFDTCLSFGGINSFSTVANASDLNKRVVYATDGAGRVVGRKLLGLSGELKLLGFRTYTSLSNVPANARLRDIFRHYCATFAARCGLEPTDQYPRTPGGQSVPLLAGQAWYDDGPTPWASADEDAVPFASGRE